MNIVETEKKIAQNAQDALRERRHEEQRGEGNVLGSTVQEAERHAAQMQDTAKKTEREYNKTKEALNISNVGAAPDAQDRKPTSMLNPLEGLIGRGGQEFS